MYNSELYPAIIHDIAMGNYIENRILTLPVTIREDCLTADVTVRVGCDRLGNGHQRVGLSHTAPSRSTGFVNRTRYCRVDRQTSRPLDIATTFNKTYTAHNACAVGMKHAL